MALQIMSSAGRGPLPLVVHWGPDHPVGIELDFQLYETDDFDQAIQALGRFADLYAGGQLPEYSEAVDTITSWGEELFAYHTPEGQRTHRRDQGPPPSPTTSRSRLRQPRRLHSPRYARNITPTPTPGNALPHDFARGQLGSWNHPLVGTPFGEMLVLCLVLAAAVRLLSVITREYSWVDRLWSLCPAGYCVWVAASVDFDSTRLNLMAALVLVWGIRLTFNFARKGGYWKGGEDYRWGVLREGLGPIRFQGLNISFIAPGQMVLIWLFTSPVHQAWLWWDAPLTILDGLATVLFLACLAGETIADEQMWAFQQDKKRKLSLGEPVAEPFLSTGLYSYSRHPNYVCEMGIWWAFYLLA